MLRVLYEHELAVGVQEVGHHVRDRNEAVRVGHLKDGAVFMSFRRLHEDFAPSERWDRNDVVLDVLADRTTPHEVFRIAGSAAWATLAASIKVGVVVTSKEHEEFAVHPGLVLAVGILDQGGTSGLGFMKPR